MADVKDWARDEGGRFAETNAALDRASKLPGDKREARTPMKHASADEGSRARAKVGASKSKFSPSVPIADLHASQEVVSRTKLAGMLKASPSRQAAAGFAKAARVDGKLVLVDGHHRVAAAIMRGETHVPIHVHE